MILTSPMLLSTTSPTIITLQILLLAHLHAIPSSSLSSSLFHAWYHFNFGYTKC